MDALNAIMSCIPCTTITSRRNKTFETATDAVADDFVKALLCAEKGGKELDEELDGIVGTTGWNWEEGLAKAILAKLEHAIAIGAQMASAMSDAVKKSTAAAEDFAKDHPVYATLIAIGVLTVLSPWAIEALGFGELGPIEGSFAAAWQRSFAGYVPRGALFTFFQRLGMVWRRNLKV